MRAARIASGVLVVISAVFGMAQMASANTVTSVNVNCFLAAVHLTHFPAKYTTPVHIIVSSPTSGKLVNVTKNVSGDNQTVKVDIHGITGFGGVVGTLVTDVAWDLQGHHHQHFVNTVLCGVLATTTTTQQPTTTTTGPVTTTTEESTCMIPEGCGTTTTTAQGTSTTSIQIGTATSTVQGAKGAVATPVVQSQLPRTGGGLPLGIGGVLVAMAGGGLLWASKKRVIA